MENPRFQYLQIYMKKKSCFTETCDFPWKKCASLLVPCILLVSIRYGLFFLFILTTLPAALWFWNIKKKKKKSQVSAKFAKCWHHVTKIVPHIVFIKQWSFEIIKIAINAPYLVSLNSNLNFFCTSHNNASNVAFILYIFGLQFNFYFYFFSRSPHFEWVKFLRVKCNPTNKKIVA